MATKAAHTAFNRSVAAYLQSIGADAIIHNGVEMAWVLTTSRGELCLSVREPERSEVFSLYGRFEDKEKWNFHSYDAKELLEEFKEQIAPLLINEISQPIN